MDLFAMEIQNVSALQRIWRNFEFYGCNWGWTGNAFIFVFWVLNPSPNKKGVFNNDFLTVYKLNYFYSKNGFPGKVYPKFDTLANNKVEVRDGKGSFFLSGKRKAKMLKQLRKSKSKLLTLTYIIELVDLDLRSTLRPYKPTRVSPCPLSLPVD